jgi:hypothetical protein
MATPFFFIIIAVFRSHIISLLFLQQLNNNSLP